MTNINKIRTKKQSGVNCHVVGSELE